jgi:hypothetical protein
MQAGGWDYMMSTTFLFFIGVSPLVRSITLLVLLLCPLSLPRARWLHHASRYVSYYQALEVMLVSVPLLHAAMGPLSANLITKMQFPGCVGLTEKFPNPPGTDPPDLCFAIAVKSNAGYWLSLTMVLLWLISGFDGSFTHKYIHRRLLPEDTRPPPDFDAITNGCARCRRRCARGECCCCGGGEGARAQTAPLVSSAGAH